MLPVLYVPEFERHHYLLDLWYIGVYKFQSPGDRAWTIKKVVNQAGKPDIINQPKQLKLWN